MAASNAIDDPSIQPDNWGPQDDQSMGPGGNGQLITGASLPVDDRSTGQDQENADYPHGSSVSDTEAFREKQVKVLRLFLSVRPLLCSLGALSGFGIPMLGYTYS
jgi:hypothetical protein